MSFSAPSPPFPGIEAMFSYSLNGSNKFSIPSPIIQKYAPNIVERVDNYIFLNIMTGNSMMIFTKTPLASFLACSSPSSKKSWRRSLQFQINNFFFGGKKASPLPTKYFKSIKIVLEGIDHCRFLQPFQINQILVNHHRYLR